MLSRYLQLEGCMAQHTQGAVDLLIAHAAVQYAASKNNVVISDDADLAILTCYLAHSVGFDVFIQTAVTTVNDLA